MSVLISAGRSHRPWGKFFFKGLFPPHTHLVQLNLGLNFSRSVQLCSLEHKIKAK